VSEEYQGPQTAQVEALLDRVEWLDNEDGRQLCLVMWSSCDVDRYRARGACREAANVAGRTTWQQRARSLARDGYRGDSWLSARHAAADAAAALVVRDLVDDEGYFTQEQYRLLTGSWANVVGPAHPDDVEDRP
jgi:hypothetical protein